MLIPSALSPGRTQRPALPQARASAPCGPFPTCRGRAQPLPLRRTDLGLKKREGGTPSPHPEQGRLEPASQPDGRWHVTRQGAQLRAPGSAAVPLFLPCIPSTLHGQAPLSQTPLSSEFLPVPKQSTAPVSAEHGGSEGGSEPDHRVKSWPLGLLSDLN